MRVNVNRQDAEYAKEKIGIRSRKLGALSDLAVNRPNARVKLSSNAERSTRSDLASVTKVCAALDSADDTSAVFGDCRRGHH